MKLKTCKDLVIWLGMVLAGFLVAVDLSYAFRVSPVFWGQETWHNPLTGQSVELPKDSHGFKSAAYLMRLPGLRWVFYGDTHIGRTKFKLIFRYRYNTYLQHRWDGTEVVEAFSVKADNTMREICGRQMLTGKAVGDRGKIYNFIQFFSKFEKDKERLPVMAVFDTDRKGNLPVDETMFCPLVASFFPQENQFFIPPSGEWINPLSEKTFVLPTQAKVTVEDIVANDYGSYQAYRITNGPMRVSLQKILHDNHAVNPGELDKMNLPKNTMFDWKNTYYGASSFETAGFSKREAKFAGKTAEGKNIYGAAFDYQRKNERVLIKVWWPDGVPISDEERAWAERIFDNSISN